MRDMTLRYLGQNPDHNGVLLGAFQPVNEQVSEPPGRFLSWWKGSVRKQSAFEVQIQVYSYLSKDRREWARNESGPKEL